MEPNQELLRTVAGEADELLESVELKFKLYSKRKVIRVNVSEFCKNNEQIVFEFKLFKERKNAKIIE